MKYIRTKDEVIEYEKAINNIKYYFNNVAFGSDEWNIETETDLLNKSIIKQSDTIEELCDERVLSHYFEETNYTDYKLLPKTQWEIMAKSVSLRLKENITDINYLGAIWTDKGLIYVAKMNEEGELELI